MSIILSVSVVQMMILINKKFDFFGNNQYTKKIKLIFFIRYYCPHPSILMANNNENKAPAAAAPAAAAPAAAAPAAAPDAKPKKIKVPCDHKFCNGSYSCTEQFAEEMREELGGQFYCYKHLVRALVKEKTKLGENERVLSGVKDDIRTAAENTTEMKDDIRTAATNTTHLCNGFRQYVRITQPALDEETEIIISEL